MEETAWLLLDMRGLLPAQLMEVQAGMVKPSGDTDMHGKQDDGY